MYNKIHITVENQAEYLKNVQKNQYDGFGIPCAQIAKVFTSKTSLRFLSNIRPSANSQNNNRIKSFIYEKHNLEESK